MTIHFCSVASFHHRYTAGNDFPHSRQNSFERDVINPQDGHILCDPKPAICGFSLIPRADALTFLNERVTKVGSVRKRGQNGRKTGSMVNPRSQLPRLNPGLATARCHSAAPRTAWLARELRKNRRPHPHAKSVTGGPGFCTAVGEFAFTFAAWRAAVAWRLWRVPGASE